MKTFLLFLKRNFIYIFIFALTYVLIAHFTTGLKLFLDDFVLIFPAILKSFGSHFAQYTHDYGLFRPFALFYYYVIYDLYLASPAIAHLAPFTLHFLSGIILFFILKKNKIDNLICLSLSLFYIALPFATEAYMWFAANPAVIVGLIIFLQIATVLYSAKEKIAVSIVFALQLLSLFFYETGFFFFIPLAYLIANKFHKKDQKYLLKILALFFIPELIYAITKIMFKPHVISHPLIQNATDLISNMHFFVSNIIYLFFNPSTYSNFWIDNVNAGIYLIKNNPLDELLLIFIIISLCFAVVASLKSQKNSAKNQNIKFWLMLTLTSIIPLFLLQNFNFPFRVLFLPLTLFLISLVIIVKRFRWETFLINIFTILLIIIFCAFLFIDNGISSKYSLQYKIDQQITNALELKALSLGFSDQNQANLLLNKDKASDVYKNFAYDEHILSCYSSYWCAQAELNLITGRIKQIEIEFKNGESSGPSELPLGLFVNQRPFVILTQEENGLIIENSEK